MQQIPNQTLHSTRTSRVSELDVPVAESDIPEVVRMHSPLSPVVSLSVLRFALRCLSLAAVSLLCIAKAQSEQATPPNILMISIDDLNDWIGCLDGHPQTQTPNMDRLAERGVNFTHAHCQVPLCNPSRASVLTGTLPTTTGVYENLPTDRKETLPTYWDRTKIATMGEHFGRHGYRTLGVGKIFHQCKWRDTFHEYGPQAHFDPPKQKIMTQNPEKWLEWGRHPLRDEDTQDYAVAEWAIHQLQKTHDQPFFLAVGFVRPHMPFCCPAPWFDRIGKEAEIELPPIKPGDRDDLSGQDLKVWPEAHTDFHLLKERGLLQSYVHAYLACIAFVDHQVGRVLDALEESPYADSTIIVLWSDHGYHLGEKERLHKFTLWQRSSRTPFMIAGPGIDAGQSCGQPVGLVDLFPTLCELSGMPALPQFEGRSLAPQLRDPSHPHPPVLVTATQGNHAVVSDRYRYIRYSDGSEELYDSRSDPHEWNNLASDPGFRLEMDALATHLPQHELPALPKTKRTKQASE